LRGLFEILKFLSEGKTGVIITEVFFYFGNVVFGSKIRNVFCTGITIYRRFIAGS